ncbi:MAG: hypothetical protein HY515_04535 [Candidatus Aenigmarchaeota archaeon]|nr:hypothetical protein [Candidatus Aenigmarchaeota archaeon]
MSELSGEYLSRMRVRIADKVYRGTRELENLGQNLREDIIRCATGDITVLEASSRFYDLGGQRVEIWYKSTRNAKLAARGRRRREYNKWGRWGVW